MSGQEQIVEVERALRQVLDRQGQQYLLKLADLENELQDELSLESCLSGPKLALGVAAELKGKLAVAIAGCRQCLT